MERHVNNLCRKALTDNIQVYHFPDDRKEYESDILMSGLEKKIFVVYGDKEVPDFPKDNEDTIIFLTSKKVSLKAFDETFEFPKLKAYSNKNDLAEYVTASNDHSVREICELILGTDERYDEVIDKRSHFDVSYQRYLNERNQVKTTTYLLSDGSVVESA